ncbi:MAG TPA: acyl-CoA thioesterase [Blastocatellia bacterium]
MLIGIDTARMLTLGSHLMTEPDRPSTHIPVAVDPAIRVVLMPKDTNAHGTIFGGVILSYLDLAAAVAVRKHTSKRFVTVAMREVVFVAPVFVGDIVSFYTRLMRIGRTSITVMVTVEADRVDEPGKRVRVTEAEVVYVAVDDDRRPVPIHDHPPAID